MLLSLFCKYTKIRIIKPDKALSRWNQVTHNLSMQLMKLQFKLQMGWMFLHLFINSYKLILILLLSEEFNFLLTTTGIIYDFRTIILSFRPVSHIL